MTVAPTDPSLLYHLAWLYSTCGAADRAVPLFRTAIVHIADTATRSQTLCQLAQAFERMGRYDSSMACLRQAFILAPVDPEPSRMMAQLYSRGLLFDSAAAYYHRAMTSGWAPDSADRCESEMIMSLARDQGDARVLNGLGLLYGLRGDYKPAERIYCRALNLARGDEKAVVLDNLAFVCIQQDRFDEAADYEQRTLGIKPRDPALNYTMALIRYRQDRNSQAIRYYDQALALGHVPDSELENALSPQRMQKVDR